MKISLRKILSPASPLALGFPGFKDTLIFDCEVFMTFNTIFTIRGAWQNPPDCSLPKLLIEPEIR